MAPAVSRAGHGDAPAGCPGRFRPPRELAECPPGAHWPGNPGWPPLRGGPSDSRAGLRGC